MAKDSIKETVSQAGAWAIIYCVATGTFLFGKRSSAVNKGGAWNLFGGRVDNGEMPRAALVRELAEEACLFIRDEELMELDCVRGTKSGASSSDSLLRDMHYFLLRLDSVFVPRLNHEHSEFRWFKHNKLPTKFNRPTAIAVKSGLLRKAKAIVGEAD